MKYKKPTKAVIAAAGYGTRFLPQTKAMPKEMLPIVDKPVIQIIVEQLVAAGVTDVIIVTGYTKRAIEDHFDYSYELDAELRSKGKDELADQVRAVADLANFVYVRQKGLPKGTSRPILNARHLIDDDEAFFAVYADDFFQAEVPEPVQLLDVYNQTGRPVISFADIDKKDVKRYGVADVADHIGERAFKLKRLVEKPDPSEAPSTWAVAGCSILTPDVFEILENEKVGVGGEIVLTEALGEMAERSEVYGCLINGIWQDAGDKGRYLQAIVDHALEDPELGADFRGYLKKRLAKAK